MERIKGLGYYVSPLGLICVTEEDNKLIEVKFVEVLGCKEHITPLIQNALTQLDEYFLGVRKTFDLPFELFGTPFQKKVHTALTKIPYGSTYAYNDVAVMVSNQKASRAVGNANNKNNLFLIVPCHRVTRKNGTLKGAPAWVKKQAWLIKHEKKFKDE